LLYYTEGYPEKTNHDRPCTGNGQNTFPHRTCKHYPAMKLAISITADNLLRHHLLTEVTPVADERGMTVTGEVTHSRRFILTVSGEENSPDPLLLKIGAIVTKLEKRYPTAQDIDVQVRNVDYAEPVVGTDPQNILFPLEGFRIVPWNGDHNVMPGMHDIVLAPSRVFGTGLHPSTRLCLHLLNQVANQSPGHRLSSLTVLDIGCGSGILTIAALRMGAARVLGVEIDPEAVAVARRNLQYNNLAHAALIMETSWHHIPGHYDLVLANLVPSVLYKSAPYIAGLLRKQGLLITAGFQAAAATKVAELLVGNGLYLVHKSSADNWGALLLSK
jgi:ribosomal protein L11 methylase PrmA